MEESLALIDRYQTWLYLLLGLAAFFYARQLWNAYQDLKIALFGLEREQAVGRLRRAATLLSLVVLTASTVFILTTYVTPSLPASVPTPLPTISLLTTPAELTAPASTPAASTQLPASALDSSGCLNPQATISEPQPNATLSGVVVVRGTAAIANFGFFKLEYRDLNEQGAWRAILAHEATVTDGDLGPWDTSLVLPGDYALRLVVVDTAGNAPMPCVIPVRIVPAP